MKAKKRGKRPGLRARSKNARKKKKATEYVVEMVHLPKGSADYVMEVGEIAEVPPSLVIAVLAANSIFHGRRAPTEERKELTTLREQMESVLAELFHARGKLAQCRQIMEANDPGNALMVFGPPSLDTAEAEVPSPQAQPAEAPSSNYPPEGVAP